MNCIDLKHDRKIFYKVLNARAIQVSSNVPYIEEVKDEDDIITSLNFGGEYVLAIGEEFEVILQNNDKTIKYKYEVNYIEESVNNSYIILSHQRNKSSVYILPLLGLYKPYYTGEHNLTHEGYLINCYITEDKRFLDLLYRFSTHQTYKFLEQDLIRHKQFIKLIDINSNYVIFRFRIPDERLSDVELFLQGKYSKMNDSYKRFIISFHGYMPNHRVPSTLFKKEQLKKYWESYLDIKLGENVELESKPNLEEETTYGNR